MFSWKDYSKVAKSLQKYAPVNSTVSEGFFRSAVSRAYYAIYHLSLEYAKSKGYNERTYRNKLIKRANYRGGKGSHAVLIQYLLDDSDAKVNKLGTLLKTCKDKRSECDYEASVLVNTRYVTIAFAHTDNILPLILTLP